MLEGLPEDCRRGRFSVYGLGTEEWSGRHSGTKEPTNRLNFITGY